jgi:dihydropteroate synthase
MESPAKNKVFSTNKTLNIRGQLVDLSVPKVMGILNVTPDSFYDGGKFIGEGAALKHAERMLAEGASFIDVGGYSSRPGATDIPQGEELERVIKTVRALIKAFPNAMISVDTFRSVVAREAVQEGACMINDISGGEADQDMLSTIAQLQVPYILMHMRGTPQTMTTLTDYTTLVREVLDFFHRKIDVLHRLKIKDIIIDPGFGFAKTISQNYELLYHLDQFEIFGKPILVGLSRKSMIWKTLKITPEEALNGTTVLHTAALLKGARLLRVHDVKEAIEAIKLIGTINH